MMMLRYLVFSVREKNKPEYFSFFSYYLVCSYYLLYPIFVSAFPSQCRPLIPQKSEVRAERVEKRLGKILGEQVHVKVFLFSQKWVSKPFLRNHTSSFSNVFTLNLYIIIFLHYEHHNFNQF